MVVCGVFVFGFVASCDSYGSSHRVDTTHSKCARVSFHADVLSLFFFFLKSTPSFFSLSLSLPLSLISMIF
jgi:hypothetical protein